MSDEQHAADPGDAAEPGSARWWTDRRERLERRRPRSDGLTVEQIVEAALVIVDDEGLEALTVRRLAARFETGSATLYRHIASRDELLVLLVDRVIGDVRLPGDDVHGRARVECLAVELRRVLMDHPSLVPALRAAPLVGPNAMRGSEHGLAALIESGFPPEVAVPAYLALVDYVLGTVFFDTGRSSPHRQERHADVLAVSPDEHPTLASHLDGVLASAPTEDVVFTFGLRTFLDGLDAQTRAPIA